MNYGVMMLYLIASGSLSRRPTKMMTNMRKCSSTPYESNIGTHKVGQITTTMTRLVEVFGKPEPYRGFDEKVNWQWTLTFEEDGRKILATIYDWKEYDGFGPNTMITWSIGGFTEVAAQLVHEFMEGA